MEDARDRPSRSEPDVRIRMDDCFDAQRGSRFGLLKWIVPPRSFACSHSRGRQNGDATVARRKCAFTGKRRWETRGRTLTPRLAVVGNQDFEFQSSGLVSDRIAEEDAVRGIPKSHRIEKTFWIAVGDLQRPMLPGVDGVINARLFAGSGGHEKSLIGREGDHRAKIERLRSRNVRCDPMTACVDGAEIGAVSAGGPGYSSRDDANASQALGSLGALSLGRGLSERSSADQEHNEDLAHVKIVAEKRAKLGKLQFRFDRKPVLQAIPADLLSLLRNEVGEGRALTIIDTKSTSRSHVSESHFECVDRLWHLRGLHGRARQIRFFVVCGSGRNVLVDREGPVVAPGYWIDRIGAHGNQRAAEIQLRLGEQRHRRTARTPGLAVHNFFFIRGHGAVANVYLPAIIEIARRSG